MVDIIIYTTRETLEHKKGADGYEKYYWNLPKAPIKLKEGNKIYFACERFIQGYFIVEEYDPNLQFSEDEMIVWRADSWIELKKKIPTKPFQGFKYADKVEGLNAPSKSSQ